MARKNGKKSANSQSGAAKSQQSPAQEVQVENVQEQVDQSFKCGLRHTGEVALEPGVMIMTEKPVLSILRKSATQTKEDLQAWVEKFAALDANTRDRILDLDCHDKAAPGGALAELVGKSGEKLGQVLKVPLEISPEQAWELLRIVEANMVEVSMKGGGSLSMLLLMGSHLKHSCVPNALLGLGEKAGTVEVRALRTVNPGDEVTISYLGEQALLCPAPERRARLNSRWQFMCACDRCAEPDLSRAFRCAKLSCKGLMYPTPAGNSLTACDVCGKTVNPQTVSEYFAAEGNVASEAPEIRKKMQIAAGSLSQSMENRDAEAFASASELSLNYLGKSVMIATKNKQVDPSHHVLAGLANSAASVRTMLGDSAARTGRDGAARKMWVPAAGELKEAMDAQSKALPLPIDSRVVDLIGLAALHNRLDKPEAARECFVEAKRILELISWATAPARREELEAMRKGVESALAGDA